jgi:hypothetical protein
MGRLLELVSALPPTSAVLTPLRKETRVRQDASRRSLQPTYCQRAPLKPTNSRARDSHLTDRLFQTLAFPQHACAELGPTLSEGAPDSPRASPIPSDEAVGAAPPVMAFQRSHPSLFERGHPCFSWGVSTSALGFSPATQAERCGHPHSLSRCAERSRFHESVRCRAKDPFHRHPPRRLLSRSEVPSTDRSSPPRPCWRWGRDFEGRHWSLGLAAVVQLPTRVRPYCYRLGLVADRLFTGASQATCRLPISTVVWTSEHDHRRPNSSRIHHTRRTVCAGDSTARRGDTSRDPRAQG